MNKMIKLLHPMIVILFVCVISLTAKPVMAETAVQIRQNVNSALKNLYAASPTAKELSKVAKAILVFPSIVKGGLIIGGQYGEGALVEKGKISGYFNSVAASYGLQAGLQKFGYALFLMDDDAIRYLDKSEGWELGVGPNIVVVDEGVARNLSTTTAKEGIYAFFFSQKGLMAGIGLQGSKITRIQPK
ncbi:MAG: twin-arginine translocation pathway signal protein [Desulfobulbaceae bacterium]|nr:twin-arginine translocation pathway signal protein [Desulfobulbaceae bacterium]